MIQARVASSVLICAAFCISSLAGCRLLKSPRSGIESVQHNAVLSLDDIFAEEEGTCPVGNEPTFGMLKAEFENMYEALSSVHASTDVKRESINRVAQIIDRLCEKECGKVLSGLQILNDHLKAEGFENLVKNRLGLQQPVAEESVQQIRKMVGGFTSYLEKNDGNRLTARMRAFVEFVRHVAQLNSPLIFALAEQSPRSLIDHFYEQDSEFQAYLSSLFSQGSALFLLGEVATKYVQDKNHEMTNEDARKLAQGINNLGFFYAKFAQSLSNFFGGVDSDHPLMEHFQRFQENLDPMDWGEVVRTFREEFGERDGAGKVTSVGPAPEEIFEIPEYDKEEKRYLGVPRHLATATIGQTYRWKLWTADKGLRDVIVKVQRPGRAEELAGNVELNRAFLKLKDVVVAGETFAPLVDLVLELLIGFEKSVERELDFRKEAENLRRARSFLGSQRGVEIPVPIERYTRQKVLTMELAPGVNIEKMITGRVESFNPGAREQVFVSLLDSVLFQFLGLAGVYGIGWLHGDMHPGNLMATPDGKLSIIDWANTLETGGLVWQPMAATLSFALGNEVGFVAALKKLARPDSQFDQAGFQTHVRKVMDEIGLSRIRGAGVNVGGYSDRVKAIQQRMDMLAGVEGSQESSEKIWLGYLGLLNEALKSFRWVPTDRYANLIRTSIPTAMSLYGLMTSADKDRIKRLLKDRWWRVLVYQWPLRTLYGHVHYNVTRAANPVVQFVLSHADKAGRALRECRRRRLDEWKKTADAKTAEALNGFGDLEEEEGSE